MDERVRKIYENAKAHMKNTPEDWRKVIRCFAKIHTEELDADIQEAVMMLEKHMAQKAAETNDRLRSREGAAELIGISPNMLAKYENDLCKCIPVESVVMMADVYNEPSLLNYYCTHECMIGKTRIPEYEKKPIEQIALQMLYMMKGMDKTKDDLLEITADGVIDDDEKPKLEEILKSLDDITKAAGELRIYAEKNLGITGVIR